MTRRGQGLLTGQRVALSFLQFALLLAAYYLIRPVRDALAAGLGAEVIKYLSGGVFLLSFAVAALYGWLVSRIPRHRLVPGLYLGFALKVASFGLCFHFWPGVAWLGAAFYLWVAVFNLVMVASFWSFMADLWGASEGPGVFGRIAAGGSFGGLVGPIIAQHYAPALGPDGLSGFAAALLALSAVCSVLLLRGSDRAATLRFAEPLGGSALAGLQLVWRSPLLRLMALLLAIGSLLGMWVYIEVARVAAQQFPLAGVRTAYFAERDLWVNGASLALQWLLAPWLMRRLGPWATLALVAMAVSLAFGGLAVWATPAVLLAVNVLTRTLEFAFAKPSRDVLYTQTDAASRYKAKNVLDTVYFRGCDALSGWLHAAFVSLGGALVGFGVLAAGIAALQCGVLMREAKKSDR